MTIGVPKLELWDEGKWRFLMRSEKLIEKIKYIHNNPVKRGYIDVAEHWRYSSARDYKGISGLLEVERLW